MTNDCDLNAIRAELRSYCESLGPSHPPTRTVVPAAYRALLNASGSRTLELTELFESYPDRDMLPETMKLCDNPETVFLGMSLIVAAILSIE